jgi:hypothetical protein
MPLWEILSFNSVGWNILRNKHKNWIIITVNVLKI